MGSKSLIISEFRANYYVFSKKIVSSYQITTVKSTNGVVYKEVFFSIRNCKEVANAKINDLTLKTRSKLSQKCIEMNIYSKLLTCKNSQKTQIGSDYLGNSHFCFVIATALNITSEGTYSFEWFVKTCMACQACDT